MAWTHMIPPSVLELIIQRVVSLLKVKQEDEDSVPTIGRSHLHVGEHSHLPRQDVLLAKPEGKYGEDVEQVVFGDQVSGTLTFAVVNKYTGSNAAGSLSIDRVGDPLRTRTIRALLQSDAFEGLPVTDVRHRGTDFYQEQANVPLGQAHMFFEIDWESKRTDPTAVPDPE